MATIKYDTPTAAATILSTELNSLADGGNKLSAARSNDAAGELYLYADFEFSLATSASRTAPTRIDMYLLIELDGSNYGYGDDSTDPPESAWVGSFIFDGGTTARIVHVRGVELPPTDFKVLLVNNLGVATPSSGNTLKISKYNLQSS